MANSLECDPIITDSVQKDLDDCIEDDNIRKLCEPFVGHSTCFESKFKADSELSLFEVVSLTIEN